VQRLAVDAQVGKWAGLVAVRLRAAIPQSTQFRTLQPDNALIHLLAAFPD